MPTCLLQTHCRLDSNQRAARADPRPLDDYEFLRVITSQYGCYLQITLTICKHTSPCVVYYYRLRSYSSKNGNSCSAGFEACIKSKMCLHMVGVLGNDPSFTG